MTKPKYVIIDVKNNEVWNHRTRTWGKTMTRGCLYASVIRGRRRRGTSTSPSPTCEHTHDFLHREEENFHRELEIQSLSYMAKDPIKRDIVINL